MRDIKFRAFINKAMCYEGFHISAPGIVWEWVLFPSNSKSIDCPIMQYTGLKDKKSDRDVYENDIYFENDSDEFSEWKIYFVITWINERAAFAMLEVSEYSNYINNGFNAIERDFDGFYFEITQDSIDKMHYAGNVYENPELLTTGSEVCND